MSIGPVDSETGSDHADSIRRDGLMFGASEPGRSRAAGTASTGDAPSGTDAPAAAEADGFWGDDGFTFADVLDIINPLQHIPVVSTLYRSLTGETIAPSARLMGGALFGGPIGFASAMINSVIEGATGADAGEHLLALLGDGTPAAEGTRVAAAATPAAANTPVRTAARTPLVLSVTPLPASPPQVAVPTPAAPAAPAARAATPVPAVLVLAHAQAAAEGAVAGSKGGVPTISAAQAGGIAVWQPMLKAPLSLPVSAVKDTASEVEAHAETGRKRRAEEFTAQELAQRLRLYASRRESIGPSAKLY